MCAANVFLVHLPPWTTVDWADRVKKDPVTKSDSFIFINRKYGERKQETFSSAD